MGAARFADPPKAGRRLASCNCHVQSYRQYMAERLSEAELEWRRAVGARISQAIYGAGLSISDVARMTGEPVSQISRYTNGLRKFSPHLLENIARVTGVAVEDLIATDRPLPAPTRTGRCREQFVLEEAGLGYRIMVLLACDLPGHEPQVDHHDPRGFTWFPDQVQASP